jgi:hypothetical protein
MPSAGIATGTAEGSAALVATGVAGGVAAKLTRRHFSAIIPRIYLN